jgi:hypothetical protein
MKRILCHLNIVLLVPYQQVVESVSEFTPRCNGFVSSRRPRDPDWQPNFSLCTSQVVLSSTFRFSGQLYA